MLERNYIEARKAWKKALPNIKRLRKELRDYLEGTVDSTAAMTPARKVLEMAGVDELLAMAPQEVERMLRDYDEFTRTHDSLLEEERGLKLEAQRHMVGYILNKYHGLW